MTVECLFIVVCLLVWCGSLLLPSPLEVFSIACNITEHSDRDIRSRSGMSGPFCVRNHARSRLNISIRNVVNVSPHVLTRFTWMVVSSCPITSFSGWGAAVSSKV